MTKRREDRQAPQSGAGDGGSRNEPFVQRHLTWGWCMLLVFLTLGIVLEALHGFKVQAYLAVDHETRRLMWTLTHTHGTLIGLLHLGLAFTLRATSAWPEGRLKLVSNCLIAAGLLMPAGFFLGGVWFQEGDPGLGILLVPAGGVALFAAVLLTALRVRSS